MTAATIIEGKQIPLARLITMKHAIKLEILGLKHSRGRSVTAQVKQELGFKGSKRSVLDQLTKHIEKLQTEGR